MSNIDFAADAATMLAAGDFGVTVVFGGTTTVGIIDAQDMAELRGSVIAQNEVERSVLVRSASLTGLAVGTGTNSITVNGTAYTVRDVQLEPPDGVFTRIYLRS